MELSTPASPMQENCCTWPAGTHVPHPLPPNTFPLGVTVAHPGLWLGASVLQPTSADGWNGAMLCLDSANGEVITGWTFGSGYAPAEAEVSVLHAMGNHRVLWAGWMDQPGSTVDEFPSLAMGRMDSSCQPDPGFCHGDDVCEQPQQTNLTGYKHTRPRAIDMRPGSGDIVLALDGNFSSPLLGNQPPMQRLVTWSRDGNRRRAFMSLIYPAQTEALRATNTAALYVDDSQILLAGARRWNDADWDPTVSRHLALDSIFADQFEILTGGNPPVIVGRKP